jgi:hypothetical protein
MIDGAAGERPERGDAPLRSAAWITTAGRGTAVVAGAPAWLHPIITSAGGMSGALLDPFWVGRRGDQFDQSCR